MSLIVVIGVVAVLLVLYVVGLYNGLVGLKNQSENGWSQIDVQLKRRHDLIPNLVNTVKGYAAHEKETFENVTRARQQAVDIKGGSVQEQSRAENMLSGTLKSLFAVAENYPELKANQNFLALQEELSTTENKISFARQFYNDAVMKFNNKVQMFPSSIVAGMYDFKPKEFFEVEDTAVKEVPKVEF